MLMIICVSFVDNLAYLNRLITFVNKKNGYKPREERQTNLSYDIF